MSARPTLFAERRAKGENPTEQYWLHASQRHRGVEYQVTGWRATSPGRAILIAVCPTYDAAAAAFRLATIECDSIFKF